MTLKPLWLASLIVVSFIQFASPLSFAEFVENSLTITVDTNGVAKVTEKIDPKITVSSIKVQAVSDKTSKILAVDQKDIVLSVAQSGNLIRIDTLGASHVTLTYFADIINKTSGIWEISYVSNMPSTVILPPASDIISVGDIPIDINGKTIVMPPGTISISYTTRSVTTNTFNALWSGINYPVQIMTSSKVQDFDFDQDSKSIVLTVANDEPILAIIPKSLIGGPYVVELNQNPVEFKQYYDNSTHSWLRIDPTESGPIKIVGSTVVPEFPIIGLILVTSMVTILITTRTKWNRN